MQRFLLCWLACCQAVPIEGTGGTLQVSRRRKEPSFSVLFSTGISVRDTDSINLSSLHCSAVTHFWHGFFATTATVLTVQLWPVLSSQFLLPLSFSCSFWPPAIFSPLACYMPLYSHIPPFEGLNLILGRASSKFLSSFHVPSPSALESSFTSPSSQPCLTTYQLSILDFS